VEHGVIGCPDLDAVETCLPAPPGRLNETVDRFLDLGFAHPVRAVRVVIAGQARGGPAGMERIVRVGMLADMIELLYGDGAIAPDGFGNLAEMRDDAVVARAEIATSQHGRLMHGHRFHHDHASAAYGALGIVGHMAL